MLGILHVTWDVIIPTGQRTQSVFLDCSAMPEIDFTIVQVQLTLYTGIDLHVHAIMPTQCV